MSALPFRQKSRDMIYLFKSNRLKKISHTGKPGKNLFLRHFLVPLFFFLSHFLIKRWPFVDANVQDSKPKLDFAATEKATRNKRGFTLRVPKKTSYRTIHRGRGQGKKTWPKFTTGHSHSSSSSNYKLCRPRQYSPNSIPSREAQWNCTFPQYAEIGKVWREVNEKESSCRALTA